MNKDQDLDFKHYLLTEYNLDYSGFTNKEYTCDDNWHTFRNQLFEDYCVPSVKAQVNQTFEWVIFFNDDKKNKYREFLNRVNNKSDTVHFIFVKPDESHVRLFREYLTSTHTHRYLITTRMDNDDCISKDFIDSIQKKFSELKSGNKADDLIINVGNGYQYELKFPYRKAVVNNYHYSPFVTHVFKTDDSLKTVLDQPHHLWENHLDSVEIDSRLYWTQVIHQNNLANRVLSLKLLPVLLDSRFPVIKKTTINNYWFGLLFYPLQFLITLAHRILEKIKREMRNRGS